MRCRRCRRRCAPEATARVRSLQPAAPDAPGLRPHTPPNRIETRHFSIALDPQTGAISRLRSKKTGREWASTRQPLALFSYQTLSKERLRPLLCGLPEKPRGLGSEGFRQAQYRTFRCTEPHLDSGALEAWHQQDAKGHRIVARLAIDDAESAKAGLTAWPEKMYLELLLPDAEPVVEIRFSWFGKAANRMPEALWLTFQPAAPDPHGWMLDKSGSSVSPFDVVTGGNRAMHAVLGGLRYRGPEGALGDRDAGRAGGCAGREAAACTFRGTSPTSRTGSISACSTTAGAPTTSSGSAKTCGSVLGSRHKRAGKSPEVIYCFPLALNPFRVPGQF